MTTGERIRARRKEINVSPDELADKIGVSRSTIFRWENGFIEKMPVDKLVPIARVLQTTVGYLMGWEDEEQTPASGAEDGYESEAKRFFEALPENRKLEALNYLRYLAANPDKQ
ncbi:MAG: transcriptional repressor DicA [Eubacterium sp.]|jgi:transcriptional regulator with XRE-family HTH domain|nr:transcriptional repressor DicA [Eubacterium sp.]